MLTHISYADGHFIAYQRLLRASALAAGCDRSLALGPADIDPEYRARHAAILSAPRGAGYWLWKPWIALRQLQKMAEGELLLYTDAGMLFVGDVAGLLERFAGCGSDLLFFGEGFSQGQYTRRDVFLAMAMDSPAMAAAPQRFASAFLLRNSPWSRAFMADYLALCEDPTLLTDQANQRGKADYPDFVAHRHDQSIFSLLTYREELSCEGQGLLAEGLPAPSGQVLNHSRCHSTPGELVRFLLRYGLLGFAELKALDIEA